MTPPRIEDAAVEIIQMQQGYIQKMQHVYL